MTGCVVTMVGTYPPTTCGLASFASNLARALVTGAPGWTAQVVRVVDEPSPIPAPEVVCQWVAGDGAALAAARQVLAAADVVLLQHEYGIYPGADGEEVLDLVEGLPSPVVPVLHTALRHPSDHQRAVLGRLLAGAAAVVVLSHAAGRQVRACHDLPEGRLVTIPHGAAANVTGPTDPRVPHPCFLTWGLLSEGKGIEHGLAALARLPAADPRATYVVAGQTHPKVRAAEGERYRDALRAQAAELGVADRVVFDDGYHDAAELRRLVRTADAVLLPYDSRDQVSSGVLAEALASGKPVVATCFPHAVELLAGGAGILVDHGDVDAMTSALHAVLTDHELAARMATAARRAARPLLWPAVGRSYRSLLAPLAHPRVAA